METRKEITAIQRAHLDRALLTLIKHGHTGAAFALCSPLHDYGDLITILLTLAPHSPELSEVLEDMIV